MKLISIVVPMYNEEEGAAHFLTVLHAEFSKLTSYRFEVVVVNDGSKDRTYDLLQEEMKKYPDLVLVDLSRNFGQENAIAAGLSVARGDAVIPMDADLQDPPSLIPALLAKYEEGYDVVNAKRGSRRGESAFKKGTARLFYRLIARLSGKVSVPENVGHYRLMSRRVVDELNRLPENVRVLQVEVPFLGFKTATIEFGRVERTLGQTHYNVRSLSDLALNAIITLTTRPLRLILHLTLGLFLVFLCSGLVELILFIIDLAAGLIGITEVGYLAWLIINVLLLLCTFVFGALTLQSEYLAAVAKMTQDRPFYLIASVRRHDE